jgi:hypothetical protein
MRILLHRLSPEIDVCPRLGLILAPVREFFGRGRMVRHVLAGSPAARAGIRKYDIALSINGKRWDDIHHLVLSDRRASVLTLEVWMPRYFRRTKISLRVDPEPFEPMTDIMAAATRHVAKHPLVMPIHFTNPNIPECLVGDRPRRRRSSAGA